ncbi:serine hydrolase [Ornithinimicrobium faecis]|uniref:serine hydrolase n=1 Tax=Ornithinimicrobium faecis TaxID=2934158 RepID=UPI002117496B|nr:serine hydrolase [Ornithinimicrobium sp. HY1745]
MAVPPAEFSPEFSPELPARLPIELPLGDGLSWSVSFRAVTSGRVLHAQGAHDLLPTASVGKVFALIDLAARATAGEVDLTEIVDRRDALAVADSGTWQHLHVDRLSLADVAVLIGSTSDNWATNVLLDRLGLDQVQRRASTLVSGGSTLHDHVRDVRTNADPATLSSGCADDWTHLLGEVARGTCIDEQTSALVRRWLSLGTDLSMVAAAFDLDPLAHAEPPETQPTHTETSHTQPTRTETAQTEPDLGIRLFHKTGTDVGVRADVGVISRGDAAVAYACLCRWDDDGSRPTRHRVLAALRELGECALDLVTAEQASAEQVTTEQATTPPT